MSTNHIITLASLFLAICALIAVLLMNMRMKKFFRGGKGENMEQVINDIAMALQKTMDLTDKNTSELVTLRNMIEAQGRGIALVRFNPFPDVGGTQSFAVAIVNKEGDGVVFSSLYSRERMSVFAKPVKKETSDVELTPEESAVIKDAVKNARI